MENQLEETVGYKMIGKFNLDSNETIDKIKSLAIEMINLIEAIPTNGRISAATKTKAQMSILDGQMESVKVLFYPKDI